MEVSAFILINRPTFEYVIAPRQLHALKMQHTQTFINVINYYVFNIYIKSLELNFMD